MFESKSITLTYFFKEDGVPWIKAFFFLSATLCVTLCCFLVLTGALAPFSTWKASLVKVTYWKLNWRTLGKLIKSTQRFWGSSHKQLARSGNCQTCSRFQWFMAGSLWSDSLYPSCILTRADHNQCPSSIKSLYFGRDGWVPISGGLADWRLSWYLAHHLARQWSALPFQPPGVDSW